MFYRSRLRNNSLFKPNRYYFFGRKGYEQLLEMAPDAFADKTKIVFSNALNNTDREAKIINGNIAEEVNKIVNSDGKNIWLFEGVNLTTTMIKLNHVDELIIAVHPLILGDVCLFLKKLIFKKKLKLTDTKTYSTGLVQLFYEIQK
ncbi:MAG: dihydrofolate reductase family protein [Saprospiraceae bacterium]|nr:dihydrofolate reductase family protein [Saprospiraceae bacterium]